MYYLALLTGREDESVARPGTAEFDAEVAQYAAFDARVGEVIAGGAALYPADTAITVRRDGGTTLVTDGPFAEHAEVVGGFYVFDVADLDEAIALARHLPAAATGAVELRPLVQWLPHGEPGADWWMALLWEHADSVAAPGTSEWESAVAEHERFGARAGAAIRGGGALRPPATATTVRSGPDTPLITDGPFTESAEVVAGLYLFAAPDASSATELAALIPIGHKGGTEVRRVVDLSG
ncbi:YciI family protein [Nocardia sp. NBC_01329]|uniref:YciI family protein n=1 Tax=Nocardia sp. NBC_01329 TaxID=2903594 RepID=UPI002E133CF8|nr:YciI family protein [Nocardia sp. NBC_01329]